MRAWVAPLLCCMSLQLAAESGQNRAYCMRKPCGLLAMDDARINACTFIHVTISNSIMLTPEGLHSALEMRRIWCMHVRRCTTLQRAGPI